MPPGVSARANPKSSTGRVDVFVRLLTDRSAAFDDVAEGYAGPMWVEIAPQTFSVLVRPGTRVNQLRLKRGSPPRLATVSMGVDLTGAVAGFRARRHAGVVDLDHEDGHDPRDFWQPLSRGATAREGASSCLTPASSTSWPRRKRWRSPRCKPRR